jgi:hypothetical protein
VLISIVSGLLLNPARHLARANLASELKGGKATYGACGAAPQCWWPAAAAWSSSSAPDLVKNLWRMNARPRASSRKHPRTKASLTGPAYRDRFQQIAYFEKRSTAGTDPGVSARAPYSRRWCIQLEGAPLPPNLVGAQRRHLLFRLDISDGYALLRGRWVIR